MMMIQDGGHPTNIDYSNETQRALSLVRRLMTSSPSMRTEDNRFRHELSPVPPISST